MAGDWTPFEAATLRKPEVLTIASKTGRTRHEVCGLLMELWCWAGEQTVDGHVDAPVDGLSSAVGADPEFWAAVVSVGWLEGNGAGMFLPNAENWITKGAKARLDKTKRQQKWRDKGAKVDASVDKSAPTEAPTTVQKRTVQKKSKKKTPKAPLLCDYSEAFLRFWDAWPAGQRKQAKPKSWEHWQRDSLDAKAEHVIALVEFLKTTDDWQRGRMPMTQTWLNQKRWDCDLADLAEQPKTGGFNRAKPRDGTYDGVAKEFTDDDR